jgi:hypothetical protein
MIYYLILELNFKNIVFHKQHFFKKTKKDFHMWIKYKILQILALGVELKTKLMGYA